LAFAIGLWVKESTTTPEIWSCAEAERVKIRNRKETIALTLPHFDLNSAVVLAVAISILFIVNSVIGVLVKIALLALNKTFIVAKSLSEPFNQ
jgi:hypothetical protein